ncbi:sigma-70 family RNA polymerase sigma factor [Mumia sp. zg.B53]|uniref:sigma-70 family RNA polymerase sigma factor n=1 Tax=Mumia sp. zg.B53 TaxID=2855449 RepID=UPI001C6F4D62|nr:sigma-70 family RNA polymerase sigma factor [Mumia sp. zg.B53]MBW9215185.1 sigma-70 family RNA polymerase sigma factor [Mumia sp. zg.B53]
MSVIATTLDRPHALPRDLSREERRTVTTELCEALADCNEAHRDLLQARLVEVNMGVARAVASQYRNRGVDLDDLEQVAYVGLAKAARGFDPARGHDFLTYAVPTIRGEVRRWFRDSCWMVRPVRRVQETRAQVVACVEELVQTLGETPTPEAVAQHLALPVEEVNEAMAADGCYHPSSLDSPGINGVGSLADVLGETDDAFARAEEKASLAPLVRRLSDRDRETLALRYFHQWTQEQIAGQLGVTQMQVSRILSRIVAQLREQLGDGTLAA